MAFSDILHDIGTAVGDTAGVISHIGPSPVDGPTVRKRQRANALSDLERQDTIDRLKDTYHRVIADPKLTDEQRKKAVADIISDTSALYQAHEAPQLMRTLSDLNKPPMELTGNKQSGMQLKPGTTLSDVLAMSGAQPPDVKWTPYGTKLYDTGNGQMAVPMKNDSGELKFVPIPAGWKVAEEQQPTTGKEITLENAEGKTILGVLQGTDTPNPHVVLPTGIPEGYGPAAKKTGAEAKPGSLDWYLEQEAKRLGKPVASLTPVEVSRIAKQHANDTQPYAGPRFKLSEEKTATDELGKVTDRLKKFDDAIGKVEPLVSALETSGPVDVGIILQYFDAIKGSGVRFTDTEKELIRGARGWAEGLIARGQHVASGTELEPKQRKKMVQIIKSTQDRISKQRSSYLNGLKATNPSLFKTLEESGTEGTQPPTGTPKTADEFDKMFPPK